MPGTAGEDALAEDVARRIEGGEQLILLVGSGVTAPSVPRLAQLLTLAERYASGVGDNGDLARALAQARAEVGTGGSAVDCYVAYRRVFADWVSGAGFDLVAQQAVLEAFRPPDWSASPLAAHGIWQRMDLTLGERAENATESWQLPLGVQAIGRLLVHRPDDFSNRILTTNFDPLLEVAVRRAEGRAVSIPVDDGGRPLLGGGAEGAVRVYHLHGFWRPTPAQDSLRLLHDPGWLRRSPDEMVSALAELITGDGVCVVGYSGWDTAVTSALRRVREERRVALLWAQHAGDPRVAPAEQTRLRDKLGDEVSFYSGVDGDRFLTNLAARLRVPALSTDTDPGHRVRHAAWERELISQPYRFPPQDALRLLHELARRFDWGLGWASREERMPSVLFWPIRLRQRASLIHAVQAMAAGALAQHGVRLVVCLDDLGLGHRQELASVFRADLTRWIGLIHPGVDPEFSSLQDFIEDPHRRSALDDPESLIRPTHPWGVAQAYYGRHNPSLYSVLAAMKVVPNVALRDLDEYAPRIVQALLSKDANRLLTPVTIWAFLHDLLRSEATTSVMTLGGRDEGLFWEQWHEAFQLGVNQLYNPYIKSLTNESRMVHWSSVDDLRQHLTRACGLAGWDEEGSYVPWLFQNGMLLPIYLTRGEPPEVDGFRLDSWASFKAALDDGAPVLDLLAERVSELYLGRALLEGRAEQRSPS